MDPVPLLIDRSNGSMFITLKNRGGRMMKSALLHWLLAFSLLLPSLPASPQWLSATPNEDRITRVKHRETGYLSFIGVNPEEPQALDGAIQPSIRSEDRAMDALGVYGEEFGLTDPHAELTLYHERRTRTGSSTRYQQMYEGIPVIGGELIVHLDRQNRLTSISGEISPGLSLPTRPAVPAEEAAQTALAAIAKAHSLEPEDLYSTPPMLWVYDERLLRESTRPAELVWRMEISAVDPLPINELVLVDARTGGVSLHFNQIDSGWAFTGDIASPESTQHANAAINRIVPSLLRVQHSIENTAPAALIQTGTSTTETERLPSSATPEPALPAPAAATATLTPSMNGSPTAISTPNVNKANFENSVSASTPTPFASQPAIGNDHPIDEFTGYDEGAAYYVLPSGDDANDCLTPLTACQSVQSAMDKALSNDRILIGQGTYPGGGGYVADVSKHLLLSGGWDELFSAQSGFSHFDGQDLHRVVHIAAGATVGMERIVIENGNASNPGEAGGGIENSGELTFVDGEIRGNHAAFNGGGVYSSGTLVIERSGVIDNTSGDTGGGIIVPGGYLTMRNVTLSSNHAASNGGAFFSAGTVQLNNVTITLNHAGNSGGGFISGSGGSLTTSNSLIAQNQAAISPECLAPSPIVSLGYNLLSDPTGCDFTSTTGDLFGLDPHLGSLQGTPGYHLFPANSAAADSGNPAVPTGSAGTCEAVDQLGEPRPQDSDDDGSARCDIGAVERETQIISALLVHSGYHQGTVPQTPFPTSLQALVLDQFGLPLEGISVAFSAPSSGPSGTFSDTGSHETAAITDSSGVATAAVFTANDQIGIYEVHASVTGASDPAIFILRNRFDDHWYVGVHGDDQNHCWTPQFACASVDAAISKASHGDPVYVETGFYQGTGSEVVLIDRNITLSGGWDSSFATQTGQSVLNGEGQRQVVVVEAGVTAAIQSISIRDGYGANGGGVFNQGTLTLVNTSITENTANRGGGVYNEGALIAMDTLIQNNSAQFYGGGIYSTGLFDIQRSSLIGNIASSSGGALWTNSNQASSLVNTTVSANSANSGAGIRLDRGDLTINNSTITRNILGSFDGAGVYAAYSTSELVLANSILSGNIGGDCYGPLISTGYNLVGNEDGCTFTPADGDIVGTAAAPLPFELSPLLSLSNGTLAHFPLPGSLGVDNGHPVVDPGISNSCSTEDQRSGLRPQDGDGDDVEQCDRGAVELSSTDLPFSYTFTKYVSETGSDLQDCASPAHACRSIPTAITRSLDGDTIRVTSGHYPCSSGNLAKIGFDLDIAGGWDPAFTGQSGVSLLDGRGLCEGVSIRPEASVRIDHLHLDRAAGHGLESEGSLVLEDSIVTQSSEHGLHLISDSSSNTAIIRRSLIKSNENGGVYASQNLDIQDSAIIGNQSHSSAGGVWMSSGTLSVSNTTISSNQGRYAGGISSNASVIIRNSTITQNASTDLSAGGLSGNHYELYNTILADNRSPNAESNCMGEIQSAHHSLIGLGPCTIVDNQASMVNVDPFLLPLVFEEGHHVYHPPLPDSPAIDAGNPDPLDTTTQSCMGHDQIGLARDIDGDQDGHERCDIGAVEFDPLNPPATPVPGPDGHRRTYSSHWQSVIPGNFLCDETQESCTEGANIDADEVHRHVADTNRFFAEQHGRAGIDNGNMITISSVQFGENYYNAFWTRSAQQIVIGDGLGFARADDVIAHEFTHGVTDYESDLFYYYQSGAISESFADLWGEFVDQTNGRGNDSPDVKWLIGEDITGWGAMRSMADPTNPPNACGDPPCNYPQPDRMESPLYFIGDADISYPNDNGGVHYNSGVNNKAVYLMTEGDSFNGYTIVGIGMQKVAAIYYLVQTSYLTSGADYTDLYYAVGQACLSLVGAGDGILASDCEEVQKALDAVEMNLSPNANYNPHAQVCAVNETPETLFHDDFESGVSNWISRALSGTDLWWYSSGYSVSGEHMLWAEDAFNNSDATAEMNQDIALPLDRTAYLHFNHAFGFEYPNYDGGWVEVSLDGGATWSTDGILIDAGRVYSGPISTARDNPNAGHIAFLDDSHGYLQTRFNLDTLRGESVRFRWRLSTDMDGFDIGWFIDDVKVYTCSSTLTHKLYLPMIER